MIFPAIELEETVQVNDKTRLNAEKSFVSTNEAAITLLEIQPSATDSFIDVTTDKFLDWQYSTDGDKAVIVRITTDGAPVTATFTLPIINVVDDKLFSSDSQIVPYEPDILNYVKEGRNSFLDVHRTAQNGILVWLDENEFWDIDQNPLDKDDIINISEVSDWSKFLTLKYIFEGLSNGTDDIFHVKSLRYNKRMLTARGRAILRVDTNNDGDIDTTGNLDLRSIEVLKV